MEANTKKEIVAWIFEPKNKDLLDTLKYLKESSEQGDWFDNLTEVEKRSVEQGINDHRSGNVLKSDEFWNKVT